MGGGKKKKSGNEGKSNSGGEWVGKHRVLVQAFSRGIKSEFFVVDLKQEKVEMKHPEVVWSDNYFITSAVVSENSVTVLNLGVVEEFQNRLNLIVNEQDHNHSASDASTSTLDLTTNPPKWSSWTCTSTLDLTTNPPTWSSWAPAPKMAITRSLPYWGALGNKMFAFAGAGDLTNAEVLDINRTGAKWEEIAMPFGTPDDPAWLSTPVMPDPDKDRLIAYFQSKDSLYAYYPNHNKWELVVENLDGVDTFTRSLVANQVVGNVIYCFSEPEFFEAYDILTNKWLKVDWLFKFAPDKMDFRTGSQLVYLRNDILCLAVSYRCFPDNKTAFQFLRFSVKRIKEEHIQLKPISFHRIFIDSYCYANAFIPF